MRSLARRIALVGALIVAPSLLAAQARGRPASPATPAPPIARMQGPANRPTGVTEILNLRRQLDLTPRQVTQLDSIERVLYVQRRGAAEAMRARRDSVQSAARSAPNREAMRDSARARMTVMRPQMEQLRQADSTAGAAALRLLNDTQRQQLRELQAERRGRVQGMRAARGMQGRGGMRGRGEMRERRRP